MRHRFWNWVCASSILGLLIASLYLLRLHRQEVSDFHLLIFFWPSSMFLLATDGSDDTLGASMIVGAAILANGVLYGVLAAVLWLLGSLAARILRLCRVEIPKD